MPLYLGLMSGTSVDGVDAVLARFEPGFEIIATHSTPISAELKQRILDMATGKGESIDKLGVLDKDLADLFAEAANNLIEANPIPRSEIAAIGSHGQTLRHRPSLGFTLQSGDPSRIAEQTSIKTIADFRRRDLAAGGQGAPLVPAFHRALFQKSGTDRVIINIGGMANLTSLPGDTEQMVIGFDTGPGNVLLDEWISLQQSKAYDQDGAWGASGMVNSELLERLLDEPFFQLPPPKSTGRELFSMDWLSIHLNNISPIGAEDVQATLAEFTAISICHAVASLGMSSPELYICGGGARNLHLMQRIARHAPGSNVQSTATLGLDPDWVEAAAFAWLAWRTDSALSGNLPAVTGAAGERILGAIYPA
ncbi:anhydro-N-acetylmuramic acid kinase [Marinobacterium lutimaris]|uniref:Anhydro-N-acetylmuramic acid kinase n=1 Tax=Marinobacterium lutimaris TaxID=568106 RepID=A0A1H6D6S0_9GAMM|nr:anhydro-N-acetylmuramic acid kinase [Marinobacterium lutimaris]SEG80276.1 anhydro-N-acetylmuramic acid kinase [Marinobacterium lutimaris]